MKTLMTMPWLLIGVFVIGIGLTPQTIIAADMVRPEDQAEITKFAEKMDDEYSYRMGIDQEGAQWAKDLMLLYKWSYLYPSNLRAMPDTPETKAALQLRTQSEFAWMAMTGQGMLATFDIFHAEQTLLGSTSRLVGALFVSANFWTEIRNQCLAIDELKRKASPDPMRALNIEGCAARLKRDIGLTQVVGSNVSLFLSGGVLIGLTKKLFTRYASNWVVTRVLPLLPAFARTKWAIAGLTAAVVFVPAGFILASVRDEQETNKVFVEGLQTRIDENREEQDKASLLRVAAMKLEGDVLYFAMWANGQIPKSNNEAENRQFILNMKLVAPGFAELAAKRDELETKRQALEKELGAIPGISAKLQALGEERKHQNLANDDAKLFSRAQYLASLRLAIKLIDASRTAN